jgi:hypothetical protein
MGWTKGTNRETLVAAHADFAGALRHPRQPNASAGAVPRGSSGRST